MKTESALSLDELEQLEALCLRHENATTEADSNIENLLVDVSGITRRYFLRELLWQDIETRQQKGDLVKFEDYSFPNADDILIVKEVFDELNRETGTGCSMPGELPTRYQKIKEIGSGGIGSVWQVFDDRSQRPLAIKTLRSKFRHDRQANIRLEREAVLTGVLQHPGVPPVHDHGQLSDQSSYFAMKLIDGQTLEEILSARSNEEAELQKHMGIFEQVAQTMAYVHSKNVIHRDLKPQNIMVGEFAEVQVMDWGMAKRLVQMVDLSNPNFGSAIEDDPALVPKALHGEANSTNNTDTVTDSDESSIHEQSLTRAGDVLGTPRYMAPEQARGEINLADARADVFSLGSILFEILTAKRLYADTPSSEVLAKVAAGDLDESLSMLESTNADAKLVSLCRICLSPVAADRPENASIIANEIGEHFASVQQRAKAAEIELRETEVRANEEAKRRKTFSRMLVVVAGVFAMGLAGVIWQWNQANLNAANFKTAATEAKKNAEEFKLAESLAKQRLKESRGIVDDYFTEIAAPSGALAKLPGAGDLRRSLLLKAKDYYIKFVAESKDDDNKETRQEYAMANIRLGEIIHKLDPASQPAFDAFNFGIEELRILIEEDGDAFSETHWTSLGDGLTELSRTLSAAGRKQEYLQAAKELVEVRKHINENIDSDDTLLQLAMAESNLSGGHQDLRNKEEEFEAISQALQIGDLLLVNNGDSPKYLLNISRFHTNAGSYFGWTIHDWDQARKHLETALELVSRDLDFGEYEEKRLELITLIHRNIAMVYYHCKDIPASRKSFELNLEYAQKLASRNPLFPDYEFRLAAGWGNYSTFLFRLRKIEDAMAAHDKHRIICQTLATNYPTESNFIEAATSAQAQYCNFLPVNEENTIQFLGREKLLRQHMAQFPKVVKARQDLAIVLGSSSAEKNKELLELTAFVEKQKKPGLYPICARALALLRNNQTEEAIKMLELQKDKKSSEWQVIRSLAHVHSDQFEAAELCMGKADEIIATHKPGQYPHPYFVFLLQDEIRRHLQAKQ